MCFGRRVCKLPLGDLAYELAILGIHSSALVESADTPDCGLVADVRVRVLRGSENRSAERAARFLARDRLRPPILKQLLIHRPEAAP